MKFTTLVDQSLVILLYAQLEVDKNILEEIMHIAIWLILPYFSTTHRGHEITFSRPFSIIITTCICLVFVIYLQQINTFTITFTSSEMKFYEIYNFPCPFPTDASYWIWWKFAYKKDVIGWRTRRNRSSQWPKTI